MPPSSGCCKKFLITLMTEVARISGRMIGEERYNNLEEYVQQCAEQLLPLLCE
jgi:hypothetical protein